MAKRYIQLFIVFFLGINAVIAQQTFPKQAEGSYYCQLSTHHTFRIITSSGQYHVVEDTSNSSMFAFYPVSSSPNYIYTMDSSLTNRFSYYYYRVDQFGRFTHHDRNGYFDFTNDSLKMTSFWAAGPIYNSSTTYYRCSKLITSLNRVDVEELAIVPNPIENNQLFIKGISNKYEYQIHSIQGKILMKGMLTGEQQINVDLLRKGTFIIRLQGVEKQITKKFIKN